MKRLMLIAASLVLAGGFMVGCKKESKTESLMGEIGAAAEEVKDDAAAVAEEAKDDADKAAADVKKEAEKL
jgi:hypothetical protein